MKDNRYEWRMYSLVMYNISSMQKGVQTAHVVLEYANRYKDDNDLKEYIQHDKTLIILDGGTSLDVYKRQTLEYTPNDVEYKIYQDYGGGSDTYAEFLCPNCGKKLQIIQ